MKSASTLLAVTIVFPLAALAADPPAKPQVTLPDRVIEIPSARIWQIAFSPDSKYLAATSGEWAEGRQDKPHVHLLEVESGKEIRRISLAIASGQQAHSVITHPSEANDFVVSPSGKHVITATGHVHLGSYFGGQSGSRPGVQGAPMASRSFSMFLRSTSINCRRSLITLASSSLAA